MQITEQNLLDVDPEHLFKIYSAAELQDVRKKIQVEIEKKREELRTSVGEKYRDLLKAADTISDMRHTARDVGERIKEVTSLAQTLQEKQLIGLKISEIPSSERVQTSEDISKVLEIKLLMMIPGEIWTALDAGRYMDAAELYALAEHTNLGLTVARASKDFPMLTGLWNRTLACRASVLSSASGQLPTQNLSPKVAAGCFSSILLLEAKKIEELLEQFLDFRKTAFRKILTTDDFPTVKDKLHAAVNFVHNTFIVVCLNFLDNNPTKGLIEGNLESFNTAEGIPTISKLSPVSPLADKHLTQMVKRFRPRTSKPIKSLESKYVRDCLLSWMNSVQNLLKSEMKNLLGLIGNLGGIVAVRKKVSKASAPETWRVVEDVVGPYSVYDLMIAPHIADRTLELVSSAWQNAVSSLTNAVAVMDEQLFKDSKERKKQLESNIRWFLWKESDNKEVTLQTLGCTPRVSGLARILEDSLKSLIQDVDVYTEQIEDKEPVLDHLSSCSFESINRLSEALRDEETLQGLGESSLIVRARLLDAFTTQCPSLKKCVCLNPAKGSSNWQKMQSTLRSASECMWRLWIAMVTPELNTIILQKLDPDVDVSTFLLSRPVCEVVTIEEENEENQPVKSELRVPSQPSFSLQEALMLISMRLNNVAVHTLPRSIHQEVVKSAMDTILQHYDKLTRSDVIYQSHAWQLMFDVRFIGLLFLPHGNQSITQSITARLEAIIDPFDFNVSCGYFQANVKKCAIKFQGTFGVLVDHAEKLTVLNSLKVAASATNSVSSNEEPSVLAVSSNVAWFPLLPISSASNSRKKEETGGGQQKRRSGKDSKKDSMSADFVKSAGAFFGGLTGGWS